ncbi:hypothetical protein D2T29_12910 [Sinirhodobacter populi]|uniref:Uncharacterized protein n=1 Tax=Paenirhodobacter populi TaxID=2306993 RepID=A0A443KCZ3_9RHOB|nr:hypothetical protein [Sinirhodobacter populi]RWR30566.1 hypothetical protein D2T29_12910 [Sinirhodobacter populi]
MKNDALNKRLDQLLNTSPGASDPSAMQLEPAKRVALSDAPAQAGNQSDNNPMERDAPTDKTVKKRKKTRSTSEGARPKVLITIKTRVSEELADQIHAAARAENRSIAYFLAMLCEDWAMKNKK